MIKKKKKQIRSLFLVDLKNWSTRLAEILCYKTHFDLSMVAAAKHWLGKALHSPVWCPPSLKRTYIQVKASGGMFPLKCNGFNRLFQGCSKSPIFILSQFGSLKKENQVCSSAAAALDGYMLACIHPLYMTTWVAFVSPALYQVTGHGCTACLMEMLCRKGPCVWGTCTSVTGYSWARCSVTVCFIRLSSCDCKHTFWEQ